MTWLNDKQTLIYFIFAIWYKYMELQFFQPGIKIPFQVEKYRKLKNPFNVTL